MGNPGAAMMLSKSQVQCLHLCVQTKRCHQSSEEETEWQQELQRSDVCSNGEFLFHRKKEVFLLFPR